jgi:hypothetical protein
MTQNWAKKSILVVVVAIMLFAGFRWIFRMSDRIAETRIRTARLFHYKLTVWSGGVAVKTYTTAGKPEVHSGTIEFHDRDTDEDLAVSGTVTMEPIP